jgi:hypothetical protein
LDTLGAAVTARVRGSLSDALGDRIQLIGVTVTVADNTLFAQVTYRPCSADSGFHSISRSRRT